MRSMTYVCNTKGENNPMYGKKHSEESIIKMREAKLGKKHPNYGKHLSEETKEKIRLKRIGKNNPMYGIEPWNKGHTKETDIKVKKISESLSRIRKKLFDEGKLRITKEHRAKISLANKGRHQSKESREKRSFSLKGNIPWHKGKKGVYSKEANEKRREARMKQVFPIKDTKIEVKIQDYLKLLHVEFMPHYYISEITHKYQCDILIPSIKTIIECDGCYWHGCPICNKKGFNALQEDQIEEDKIRTKELIDKGYKVIRLWECDVKKMELNNLKERLKI